jgi:hypothetical protein
VKLLFDQNLSPSLLDSLADIYPEFVPVQSVGLDRADDTAVWDFAQRRSGGAKRRGGAANRWKAAGVRMTKIRCHSWPKAEESHPVHCMD